MPPAQELTTADLDSALSALPVGFGIAVLGQHRLVLGETGATVVGVSGRENLDARAEELVAIATATREALARHMTLVPFVDAMVVVAGRLAQASSATVVPLDLLRGILADGRRLLDGATVGTMGRLLASRRLDPPWRPWRTPDGNMTGCQDAPQQDESRRATVSSSPYGSWAEPGPRSS